MDFLFEIADDVFILHVGRERHEPALSQPGGDQMNEFRSAVADHNLFGRKTGQSGRQAPLFRLHGRIIAHDSLKILRQFAQDLRSGEELVREIAEIRDFPAGRQLGNLKD